MKYLFFTLILVTIAFADNDGCTDLRTGALPPSAANDAVQLTLLNDWVLADKALDLDVFEGPGSFYVLGADNINDWIRAFDPTTGAPMGTLTLDPNRLLARIHLQLHIQMRVRRCIQLAVLVMVQSLMFPSSKPSVRSFQRM